MSRGPTLLLLTELSARLRLACEAISHLGGLVVLPADVRLQDLAPAEQARIEQLGQQDLWALINQSNAPAAPTRARSTSPAA
jgi:hypothetical protein